MKTLFAFLIITHCALRIAHCMAAQPPLLLTWQLDPYAQTTENVIAAIERVTPTQEGGLIVDVGFNMEPSEAPSIQFVYSTKDPAKRLAQLADGDACSFPEQSMTIENRWVYAYTLPPPISQPANQPISPSRLVYARRCRFGGLEGTGRKFEGGGYAIVEGENIYMGRSGTFTIGGQTFQFEGGVLLEPNAVVETATASSKIRMMLPPNTPTMIKGKPMSFPVKTIRN